jgi:hypothetical protein
MNVCEGGVKADTHHRHHHLILYARGLLLAIISCAISFYMLIGLLFYDGVVITYYFMCH